MKRIVKIKRKNSPRYTYRGCPLTRNRSPWCFRLCVPNAKGKGRCGRIAPHTLKGKTELAIAAYNSRRRAEHCAVAK